MLTAKELRIGNLLSPLRVLDPENIPLMGYHICAGHMSYSDERLNEDWEPIKLTIERLERCGFSLTKGFFKDGPYYGHRHGTAEIILYYHSDYPEPVFSLYEYPVKVFIEYLHQLQNLFFALTGEELQIQHHG